MHMGSELQAAWRQGLKEIGQALKPFPDSIQAEEMGQIGTTTPQVVTSQQAAPAQQPEPMIPE